MLKNLAGICVLIKCIRLRLSLPLQYLKVWWFYGIHKFYTICNGVDTSIECKILKYDIRKYDISKREHAIEYNTIHRQVFPNFDPFSQKYPKPYHLL